MNENFENKTLEYDLETYPWDIWVLEELQKEYPSVTSLENIHNEILPFKPNLTFVLKVKIRKALKRLQKRRKKNRYDKFSKSFYIKAQKAFLKIAKKNKKKYYVIDNSTDSIHIENKILEIVLNKLK